MIKLSLSPGPQLTTAEPSTSPAQTPLEDPPIDDDEISRELKQHPAKKGLIFNLAVTALEIGAVFGLSCVLMPRPLVFYFAQRYGTDRTRDGMSVFDKMWVAYPGFRRSMYQVSIVWAVIFLVQAGATAAIIASTTFSTVYNWDQTLPIVAVVVAMVLTVLISRRAQRLPSGTAVGLPTKVGHTERSRSSAAH